ncbi:helix-turn-helix domain-containing protein [Rossellomorea marisflavi]|uniref:helix-turn-helix domain-containing protein n=1 Tax=Rossellomorea marisflavi TaxID=189381 RepID=UPI0013185E51|nr:helix-turn-helix domain-containing protein [Rossellomorea marisflavi]QHA35356.1 helix-turn-helix domain-containing protein [Rossellomorea marisflavi]
MVPFRPIVMTSPDTDYREYRPHPALTSFIVCYWQSVPKEVGDGRTLTSIIVPDGCTDIIYDRDSLTGRYEWSYCGMFDDYFHATSPGRAGSVTWGIRFYPGAYHRIIRDQASSFTGTTVLLDDLSPDLLRELTGLAEWGLSVASLDSFFLKKGGTHSASNRSIQANAAVYSILEGKGIRSVKEIAAEQFLSTRTLSRLFSDYVGLTPKKFSAVIRFQSLVSDYVRSGGRNVGEASASFYDQSHLYHDILKKTGKTPSQLKLSDFYNHS